MHVRRARPDETAWINERYDEIEFKRSAPERDFMLVAELDGERAGLGRLVPVGEDACELGGIVVFEQFRGRGVARAIVDELLRNAGERAIYCIPFSDLVPLYAAAGFVETGSAPRPLMEKVEWCKVTYPRGVTLMRYQR